MPKKLFLSLLVLVVVSFGAGCNQPERSSVVAPVTNQNTEQNDQQTNSQQIDNTVTDTAMYNLEDVALHTTAEDCWMVINGKVYNVTSAIGQHPGGEVILNGCGKEASAMFEGIKQGKGHSNKAISWLDSLFIGNLK